eukprot:scaffold130319_cov60-Phaeocystis_antarctica.AAC.8
MYKYSCVTFDDSRVPAGRQPSSPDFGRGGGEWSPSAETPPPSLRALGRGGKAAPPSSPKGHVVEHWHVAQNPRERHRIQGERTRSQSTITVRRAPGPPPA